MSTGVEVCPELTGHLFDESDVYRSMTIYRYEEFWTADGKLNIVLCLNFTFCQRRKHIQEELLKACFLSIEKQKELEKLFELG